MVHANKYNTIMQMFIGKLIPHCFPAAKMLEVWPLKFILDHMCLHQHNSISCKKKKAIGLYWMKKMWTNDFEPLNLNNNCINICSLLQSKEAKFNNLYQNQGITRKIGCTS